MYVPQDVVQQGTDAILAYLSGLAGVRVRRLALGSCSGLAFGDAYGMLRDKEIEKEFLFLINTANSTYVRSNIPLIGSFWSEAGSHCVRWSNRFLTSLNSADMQRYGLRFTQSQHTLRYPRLGGPEHSIVIVRLRDGRGPLMGVDNGGISGQRFFCPYYAANDKNLPEETRADIQKAIDDIRRK
jgi:hypothetical protein